MKSTKTLFATLVLATLPSFGFAMCSGYGHEQTASMSCAEGMVWDAATQTCVKVTG